MPGTFGAPGEVFGAPGGTFGNLAPPSPAWRQFDGEATTTTFDGRTSATGYREAATAATSFEGGAG